jgi:hypothetical protein
LSTGPTAATHNDLGGHELLTLTNYRYGPAPAVLATDVGDVTGADETGLRQRAVLAYLLGEPHGVAVGDIAAMPTQVILLRGAGLEDIVRCRLRPHGFTTLADRRLLRLVRKRQLVGTGGVPAPGDGDKVGSLLQHASAL